MPIFSAIYSKVKVPALVLANTNTSSSLKGLMWVIREEYYVLLAEFRLSNKGNLEAQFPAMEAANNYFSQY
jgi:hypothetical protein